MSQEANLSHAKQSKSGLVLKNCELLQKILSQRVAQFGLEVREVEATHGELLNATFAGKISAR